MYLQRQPKRACSSSIDSTERIPDASSIGTGFPGISNLQRTAMLGGSRKQDRAQKKSSESGIVFCRTRIMVLTQNVYQRLWPNLARESLRRVWRSDGNPTSTTLSSRMMTLYRE